MGRESFRVHVTKDYLKFSAAHFIAYPGFRERLHGHNYRVSVAVHDNGRGFLPTRTRGLGLVGMQERVNILGGQLNIDSEPGKGTSIEASLPLPQRFLTELASSLVRSEVSL